MQLRLAKFNAFSIGHAIFVYASHCYRIDSAAALHCCAVNIQEPASKKFVGNSVVSVGISRLRQSRVAPSASFFKPHQRPTGKYGTTAYCDWTKDCAWQHTLHDHGVASTRVAACCQPHERTNCRYQCLKRQPDYANSRAL